LDIRPYSSSDWDRVCEVHDAARRDELAAAGLDTAYLTLAQTADNEGFHEYEIRVAVVRDRVVGFVAFTNEELAWLYVDPAMYGEGVGTSLIRAALTETGAPLIAEVLDGNEAAIAAYTKAGFKVVGHAQGRMPGNEDFSVSVTELRHPGVANARVESPGCGTA
jgi:RimJ/RimL family protein N-acetyltransferase